MEYSVNCLKDFIKYVEDDTDGSNTVLFRGQANDWPLLPKLARLNVKDGNVLATERSMLESFKSRSLPFLDSKPESDWEWLSIAQHYGMPTRLLDWTTNPLAALWFAVEQPGLEGENGVVWAFPPKSEDFVSDPTNTNPVEIKGTRVFQPKHVTRRIVAQHGWFTAHPFMKDRLRFVPMNINRRYKDRLTKLIIPPTSFAPLRLGLDRCGINASTLFSDLAGVCKDLERQYSLLADEK